MDHRCLNLPKSLYPCYDGQKPQKAIKGDFDPTWGIEKIGTFSGISLEV